MRGNNLHHGSTVLLNKYSPWKAGEWGAFAGFSSKSQPMYVASGDVCLKHFHKQGNLPEASTEGKQGTLNTWGCWKFILFETSLNFLTGFWRWEVLLSFIGLYSSFTFESFYWECIFLLLRSMFLVLHHQRILQWQDSKDHTLCSPGYA